VASKERCRREQPQANENEGRARVLARRELVPEPQRYGVLIPKGYKDSAWGFNPRIDQQRQPALTRRFVLVLVVVLVLESGHAE
jgi:hypothetical protein